MGGCSGTARLRITIDTLSFLETETRSTEITIAPAEPLVVFLLPGLQVEQAGTPPVEYMTRGIEVDLPGTEDIPTDAVLT